YERLLFSVALRSGLSREDAADVTQTTFLALLDALATIRDDERLPYWLMTVARRHAWRARDRSRREVPLAEIDGGTVDPIDTAERVAAVHEGLALVGSPCRELLELLYFDPTEPSYSDISQRLGRAIG